MELVIWTLGAIVFAVGIAVSIALHEFGHLLTAKAFGMKVTRYFIGFGPRIFSFRRGETEYGLKAIPAGGFCEITGMTALEEIHPDDRKRAFYNQKVWKRVVVLSAGSITHFILGFIILMVLAMSFGLPNIARKPVLSEVTSCVPIANVTDGSCPVGSPSPAKDAGLQVGDEIVSIAGKPTPTWQDMQKVTRELSGPSEFKILRDGKEMALTVDVAKVTRELADGKGNKETKEIGAIGVLPKEAFTYGFFDAIPATVVYTGETFVNVWNGLLRFPERIPAVVKAIGGGERDLDTPISVVGASRLGGDAAVLGQWAIFLQLLAGLNFFVGVFNLLPLLPLDGGHIAVNLYERVRDWLRKLRGKPAGAPVDYMRLLPLTYVVIFLGGAITLLTVTADIVNPIRLQ